MDTLTEFFRHHPKAALAFSGGVDSSYLLYAGLAAGADITPYYIKTAFQPEFEFRDATRLADELGSALRVVSLDILAADEVVANPGNRCYYCKSTLFRHVLALARADGYSLVLDGTNASDDAADRPGMKALRELDVRSPLRECGLTKDEIRRRSKEAGLFTWDKPAYACLATRIPMGRRIIDRDLQRVERAESRLMALGFTDLRVRLLGDVARLQLPAAQHPRAVDMADEIRAALAKDFNGVLLDPKPRP